MHGLVWRLEMKGTRDLMRLKLAQIAIVLLFPALSFAGQAAESPPVPWWVWPVVLFVFCFVLGIIAVLAGVGGGVLYVPLVSGFFPFHLDFVRGAGLLVALAGALAAGPGLLRRNLASLRLALPVAVIASSCAILGAFLGLALPTNIVQICLGGTIVGIAILLLVSKNVERPQVPKQDPIGAALGMHGSYVEYTGELVHWKTHRTLPGLLLFILIGVMAGMFGGRVGQCPSPQSSHGSALEDSGRNEQIPPVHNRHLGCVGLLESGLRHSTYGNTLDCGTDARFLRWSEDPGCGEAQGDKVFGHRSPSICWSQVPVERAWAIAEEVDDARGS